MIFFSVWIVFVIQLICFLIAYFFQTDKLTDVSYGGTFVIVMIFLLSKSQMSLVHVTLTGLIVLRWIRLWVYLFSRIKRMKSDKRFDSMRPSFIKFGAFWMLQATSIVILLLPMMIVMNKQIHHTTWFICVWWAITLWGIVIESLADRQKYQFKKTHPKRRCDVGLWSKARHPNYFWEMLVWRGLWIICIPYLGGREWISILSPIWITFLLVKVSWIPYLAPKREEKYGKDPAFQEWKKKTNLLVPL